MVDPVLAVVAGLPDVEILVIFEVNALINSPAGQKLFECIDRMKRDRDGSRSDLDDLLEKTGLDLQKDIDRVAVSGGAVVISGNLGQEKLAALPLEKLGTRAYSGRRGVPFPHHLQSL